VGLSLATFNVKDLFDPADEAARPYVDAKLSTLARCFAQIDADVLALQEVGSLECLRQILERLEGRGRYGEPIVAAPDDRGIRCALLSRLPLAHVRVLKPERLAFPVFRAGDPPPFGDRISMRRGVICARVDAGALGDIDVFVAHFKSKRRMPERKADGSLPDGVERASGLEIAEAELRSLVYRAAEALWLRSIVDARLAEASDARIAVMGDLNDGADSLIVRTLIGVSPGALRACADRVPEAHRFSVLWGGRKEQLDHVLATDNLYEQIKAAVFLNETLRDHGSLGGPNPNTGASPLLASEHNPPPPTPDSDHAPFVVRFG
jgi:endonuclease/exonuclease/phosphatase family metal-dependent hydrolase